MKRKKLEETISLNDKGDAIITIDQTLLPNEEKIINLRTQEEIRNAIYKLKVRGAPAIGVCAAYGIYLGAKEIETDDFDVFYETFKEKKEYLAAARPTAVNLFWALDQMEKTLLENREKPVEEIKTALLERADEIKEDDIRTCRMIGENALMLLKDGDSVLTHCNAGRLATIRYGTALSGIYLAKEKGYDIRVFADETRPLLQGSRLTAYELDSAGIDVTVICDNMASIIMKKGFVDIVFTGADRIAANGDSANKIGTSGVAILAKHYGIPFYICAPLSTIDLDCQTGDDIVIEERPAFEVTDKWYEEPMAPAGVKVLNPAFDVTDAENIAGIITEYGIARAPYRESIAELFEKQKQDREK